MMEALSVNDITSGTRFAKRAPPDPGGYTPVNTECPQDRPTIRASHTLSDTEQNWLQKRRSKTVEPMKDFFCRLNIQGFDAVDYITKNGQGDFKNLPNIGIAFSGGGYRATTVGAGVFSAFDSRTSGSTAPGHLGGLLQSTTYISGLSGGAFMIGSLFSNNFTTVANILDQSARGQGNIWEFHRNIIEGPRDGEWGNRGLKYLQHIHDQIKAKKKAGWETSLTDYWGRGQAFQYFNDSDAGACTCIIA
jgi:lysophospholipase